MKGIIKRTAICMIFMSMILTIPMICYAKGEIRIGDLTDFTGPQAVAYPKATQAFNDYARYLNEEFGGIEGHPIKIISIDARYDVALHVSGYHKLVSVNKVHAINVDASSGSAALKPLADKDKVVLMVSPELLALLPVKDSYTFSAVTSYPTKALTIMAWIKDTWKKPTPPRIGVNLMDAAPGWSSFKAIEYLSKKYGLNIAIKTTVPAGVKDTSAQVLSLKAANLDYVITIQGGGIIAFIKDSRRLGLFPDVPIIDNVGVLTVEVVAKALGEAAVGVLTSSPFAFWHETDVPGIRLMRELNRKWHPEVEVRGYMYSYGWNQVVVLFEGIKRAIKKVGYENLNGNAIKEALETLKDFETNLLSYPITFSQEDHRGPQACRLLKCVGPGYKFEVVSDWVKAPSWPKDWWDVNMWKK